VVFALVGGRMRHGGAAPERSLPFPVLRPTQRHVARLAGSGRFRAVIAGLSGRVALPAAYAGRARRACRSCCGRRSGASPHGRARALLPAAPPPLPERRRVVTYGPHVSAYVRAKGARATVVEAPQSVDGAFWEAPATPDRRAGFQVLYAGRLEREKGVETLLRRGRGRSCARRSRRSSWPATARCARPPRPPARWSPTARSPPRRCARSTPARTSSSSRALPRATSSSRGASW
jgi:hypothetical protein